MLTEAIIIAIITGVTTIVGSYIVNRKEMGKDRIDRAKREQRIDSQLKVIEKKLDEHNHYAEKFGVVEKSIIEIKKDIEYIKKERS